MDLCTITLCSGTIWVFWDKYNICLQSTAYCYCPYYYIWIIITLSVLSRDQTVLCKWERVFAPKILQSIMRKWTKNIWLTVEPVSYLPSGNIFFLGADIVEGVNLCLWVWLEIYLGWIAGWKMWRKEILKALARVFSKCPCPSGTKKKKKK